MTVIDRVARVLAGPDLSRNAQGDAASPADLLDGIWSEPIAAAAVRKTLREPDGVMIEARQAHSFRPAAVWKARARAASEQGIA